MSQTEPPPQSAGDAFGRNANNQTTSGKPQRSKYTTVKATTASVKDFANENGI